MTAGIYLLNSNILVAILLTIILEIIVYFIWFRKEYSKTLGYCVLINLLTVPLANFFYGFFSASKNIVGLLGIEIVVFLIEFVLIMFLFKMKWWKALILSFVANVFSFILGLFIIILFYEGMW